MKAERSPSMTLLRNSLDFLAIKFVRYCNSKEVHIVGRPQTIIRRYIRIKPISRMLITYNKIIGMSDAARKQATKVELFIYDSIRDYLLINEERYRITLFNHIIRTEGYKIGKTKKTNR